MAPATPRHRLRRPLLIALAVVVAVPVLAAGAVATLVDPSDYKPQIQEAVKRATGRDLGLTGPISVTFFPLGLEARDVTFANMPGGSRPAMATLGAMEARLALWPLLHRRLDVTSLTLDHPDILLETDAQGRPNWRFTPAQGATPSQPSPSAPSTPATASQPAFGLDAIRIRDGVLTYREGSDGASTRVELPDFAIADRAGGTSAVSGQVVYQGVPFELSGTVGALSRLMDSTATTPWPVDVAARWPGSSVAVKGQVLPPAGGKLRLQATIADTAPLAKLMPSLPALSVHGVEASAELDLSGTAPPHVADLSLQTAGADLGPLIPGLRLASLSLKASAPDSQPMQFTLAGQLGGQPLAASGSLNAPAALLATPPRAQAIALNGSLGTATVAGKGTVVPDSSGGGSFAGQLALRVPDLSALSPIVGGSLPALKDISAQVTQASVSTTGAAVKGLQLTTPVGDASGELWTVYRPVVGIGGNLTSQRLDLDGLLAALSAPAGGAPPAQASNVPKPSAPPAPASGRLIPDTKLPLAALGANSADLRWKASQVSAGGLTARDLSLHAVLSGGRLIVDPFSGELPGGHMDIRLDVDVAHPPPKVALVARAPGLALQSLMKALGLPANDSGALEVDADLHGTGTTPHELAAGLDGHLGLALVNGAVDNRLVEATLGDAIRAAKLPVDMGGGGGGRTEVRCFALRLDAQNGTAAMRAFMLDTTRLRITGAGAINLGNESLALRLRPMARLGSTGVVVPLLLRGTLRQPAVTVDPSGAAQSVGGLLGQLAPQSSAIGQFVAGGEQLLGGTESGDCGPALAAARNGRAGPVPPAAPAPSAAGKPKMPEPRDLLRGLLRQ
jgi:uncharacterized protein involved in outer membrane biogenesis